MKYVVGLYLILVYFALAKSDSDESSTSEYENYEQEFEYDLTEEPPIISSEFHLADLNEFPYHVAIVFTDRDADRHEILCQGALVSRDWIMTSAYCIFKYQPIFDINKLKAYTGTTDYYSTEGYVFRILFFLFHPDFNSTTGQGTDLAMWKFEDSISKDTRNTNHIYLIDPSDEFYSNCQYSSFIGHYLYGQTATLELNDENCTEHGVSDDYRLCVILNDTMHESNKEYDWGSPLACEGKLYAMRNVQGTFCTVFDTAPWILRVIDVGSIFERKYREQDDNLEGMDYGNDYDTNYSKDPYKDIYEAVLLSSENDDV